MVRIRCDDGAGAPATATRSAPAARRWSRCCATTSRRGSSAAIRADRGDLEGPVLRDARDRGRRDHQPRAGRGRHGAVGPAVPARGPAAVEGGRRRAAARAGLHDRGRLAATPGAAARRPDVAAKAQGFRGAKIKVGKPHVRRGRRAAAGGARGGRRRIRADGRRQPGFNVSRRSGAPTRSSARCSRWLEEPLPAEDLAGHVELAAQTAIPIAVGESLYHPGALPRIPRARRVLDRAGRLRAHRRHHAVAQGRASCRDFQRRRVPAFPDGAPRLADGRGAERGVGRIHSAARRRHDVADRHRRRPRDRARHPRTRHRLGLRAIDAPAVARAASCTEGDSIMLTAASLTIRLHPDDDVVIARTQLVGGTSCSTRTSPSPAWCRPGTRSPRAPSGRRAGQALQPDHRLRQPRHRARRARPPEQPGDARVRPRLRVRRRREADAIRRRPRRRSWASSAPTAASPRATTSASCRR